MTKKRAILLSFVICTALLFVGATRTSYPSIVATTCTNQFIRSLAAATGAGSCATVSLTADVTGTLPIANGGTGDTGSAWTAYTPTMVCGQATGTAVCTGSGRYKTIGKSTLITVQVNISGTFTGGTITSATLPVNSGVSSITDILVGRETSATGLSWVGTILGNASVVTFNTYINGNTIVAGYVIVLSGVYENT